MGYFAIRAAPLGRVNSEVVEAAAFNFHPTMVRRAIPAAWALADPADIVRVRARAAATALRAATPDVDEVAGAVQPVLSEVIAAARPEGRPFFAANQTVPGLSDPVEQLWQSATALREHRGDGHVAALVVAGLDGCEAHVLAGAAKGLDPELFLSNRGWTAQDWARASDRLARRGLVAADGTLTPRGRDLSGGIERTTDELAAAPLAGLDDEVLHRAIGALSGVARAVVESGFMPFPNPIGLPGSAVPKD